MHCTFNPQSADPHHSQTHSNLTPILIQTTSRIITLSIELPMETSQPNALYCFPSCRNYNTKLNQSLLLLERDRERLLEFERLRLLLLLRLLLRLKQRMHVPEMNKKNKTKSTRESARNKTPTKTIMIPTLRKKTGFYFDSGVCEKKIKH